MVVMSLYVETKALEGVIDELKKMPRSWTSSR